MAHIPDELVGGRVEDAMQGDAELDRAEVGAEMRSFVLGDDIEDTLADLVGQRPQLVRG
jgi:hypothetical protein